VTHIDEPQVGLDRTVVQDEQVATGQREHQVDSLTLQRGDGEAASVQLGRGGRAQRAAAGNDERKVVIASIHASGFSNWGE
jgi:hypothetical protein